MFPRIRNGIGGTKGRSRREEGKVDVLVGVEIAKTPANIANAYYIPPAVSVSFPRRFSTRRRTNCSLSNA